jgi:hypothetical protein
LYRLPPRRAALRNGARRGRAAFQADWMAGKENFASLGASWTAKKGFSATAAWAFPNDSSQKGNHILIASYTFSLKKNKRSKP